MMDDLLDMTADEASLGKPVGNDLRERQARVSVVTIRRLEGADRDFSTDVERFYSDGEPDRARIADLVAAVGRHGGFDRTRAAIAGYVERAKQSLAPLGARPARSQLIALADALGAG